MTKYSTQFNNAADKAQNMADKYADKAENVANKYADKAENTLQDLESKAYNIAETIGSHVKDWLDTNTKRAAYAKDTAEETIKSNPLTSAAVAFVGGWILASLIGSSNGKR